MSYFKFLLSFSLLCVLFSTLLPLLHLHSLKPLPMQFFGFTIDKSYIFLLCNTLLVFIAINSAPINQSSPSTTEKIINHSEFNVSYISFAAPIVDENSVETESPKEEEEEEESLVTLEAENVLTHTEEDQEEESALMIIVEDEHEHEECPDEMEELNKKCEDFIRKMKAAFCSEPIADDSFNFGYQNSLVS